MKGVVMKIINLFSRDEWVFKKMKLM